MEGELQAAFQKVYFLFLTSYNLSQLSRFRFMDLFKFLLYWQDFYLAFKLLVGDSKAYLRVFCFP